jgi:glycosyltransferase involved in cell wall biosynthesis
MSASRRLRVLALGPVRGMLTGQRLAFVNYIEHSTHALRVVDIGSEGYGPVAKVMLTFGCVLQALFAMVVRRPDRVYITTSRSLLGCMKDIVLLLGARALRIPVVNHLHGNGFEPFRQSLPGPLRRLLDAAYRAIPVSIVLADGMGYHYAPYAAWMKVITVNNCSEKSLDDYPGLKSGPGEPLRVVYLSNLLRLKGVIEFARGIRQASQGQSAPGLEVRMIGGYSSDPMDVTPQELAGELEGIPNLKLLGSVDNESKWHCLAWADVMVFPSHHPGEAAPLSIIEGLAMGCMIVSTPIGYVSGLLRDTRHMTVGLRDPAAIAESITYLAGHRDVIVQARTTNVEIAKSRFSLATYVRRIDDIVDYLR